MKQKECQLEDICIKINVLKYKQLKKIVTEFGDVAKDLLNILDTEEESNMAGSIMSFVNNNLPKVESILKEFTDLTDETLDELYITDFPVIFRETLSLYGIKEEAIKNFLAQGIQRREVQIPEVEN